MKLNEKTLQKTAVIVALAALANLLWGSAAPTIKTGYELLQIASDDTASQILFAGLRFFFAGIIGVALGSILNGGLILPRKGSLHKIALLALFQTVIQYIFFYIGCANAAGYKVSIATSSGSFISILIASLVFRQEKLTARKILGCLLGFAGVVLVNLTGGLDLDMSIMGEGFILISTVSFALSNNLTKLFSKSENPVMLCGYQFILGGAFMIVISLLFGGRIVFGSLGGLLIVLYLAMVSAVAFSITSILMKYNPVSRVTIFGFLCPVFGVILSMLMLGESSQVSGPRSLFALCLVCAGVFIVNYTKEKTAA